jgi:uncharacterized repeat protein (TIGR02543 family)
MEGAIFSVSLVLWAQAYGRKHKSRCTTVRLIHVVSVVSSFRIVPYLINYKTEGSSYAGSYGGQEKEINIMIKKFMEGFKKFTALFVLIQMVMVLLPVASVHAATAGPYYPTAHEAVLGYTQFKQPSHGYTSGGGQANAESNDSRQVYRDFGISVPSGDALNSVLVSIGAKTNNIATSGSSFGVSLSWNAGSNWTVEKNCGELDNQFKTYQCNASDLLWSRSWTASELSDANFRVLVRPYLTEIGPGKSADLDWISVTIDHQVAPIAYTVSYSGNNNDAGSVPSGSPYAVTSGGSHVVQDNTGNLVKTGYTFDGWNTNTSGTGTNYAQGSTISNITSNITLYAKWKINQYTVIFESNGGSIVETQVVDHGGLVIEPLNPTKTGYNFDGWYSDLAQTISWNFDSDTVNSSMLLFAKWEKTWGVYWEPPTPDDGALLNVNQFMVVVSTDVDVQGCSIVINGGTPVVMDLNLGGLYEYHTPNLSDGLYQYEVTCVDSFDVPSTISREATIDTVGPNIVFVSPTPIDGSTINNDFFEVRVDGDDISRCKILIDGGEWTEMHHDEVNNEYWMLFEDRSDGDYEYGVKCYDKANNKTVEIQSVIIDTSGDSNDDEGDGTGGDETGGETTPPVVLTPITPVIAAVAGEFTEAAEAAEEQDVSSETTDDEEGDILGEEDEEEGEERCNWWWILSIILAIVLGGNYMLAKKYHDRENIRKVLMVTPVGFGLLTLYAHQVLGEGLKHVPWCYYLWLIVAVLVAAYYLIKNYLAKKETTK